MLLRISKIQTFESNSQQFHCVILWTHCCSEYQRYKLLKAIHNTYSFDNKKYGVAQNIKDTNFWKQFTTYRPAGRYSQLLLRISKIQTFESNSQHLHRRKIWYWRCSEYQRYKLLKAIHNFIWLFVYVPLVAQNIKDTNFWKQFTTGFAQKNIFGWLLRISKIQTFESNSQLGYYSILKRTCCSEYQRYKLLKAIHNRTHHARHNSAVAQNIKDTNFWKQFTTLKYKKYKSNKLLRISKIQTFESNSQRSVIANGDYQSCSEYQRYKLLKAIHNTLGQHLVFLQLLRISKIQTFESNSQLGKLPSQTHNVAQNIKDTNFWKQFTTEADKQYLIESCSEYQRYKLLKAIHNLKIMSIKLLRVAQNIKDTNFWKQFTTRKWETAIVILLLRISKIQTFESNSQPQ